MISLILQSYFSILLSIGLCSILIFGLGFMWIIRSTRPSAALVKVKEDMQAIAGDDVIATQLDLARAFIETGNQVSARQILKTVKSQGSSVQKAEAKQLLSYL